MDAKKVVLDGTEIEPQHIRSITFGTQVPDRDGGYPGAIVKALQVIIEREAVENPLGLGFKLATNETGKKYLWAGEIQLQASDEASITWVIKMNSAYVERYSLVNGGDGEPTIETIVIRSGDFQITAGADNATYKLASFK